MAFVTSKKMLDQARREGFAVGAFNVENMEMARAVVQTAEELESPVILQTTPSTVEYVGITYFPAFIRQLAESARVPVALHLDHGKEVSLVVRAIVQGYTSVMIDASAKPIEENICTVQEVVRFAHPNQIPVEAELGKIGGKEDSLHGGDGQYTEPEEAAYFVAHSAVDSLAVSIGTAHGIYRSTPCLQKDLLRILRAKLDLPLVLHGASGLSEKDIVDCVALGINKVNFATDLRIAFTDGIKILLRDNPSAFDPKHLGKVAMAAVKAETAKKKLVCGSAGKA